MRRRPKHLEVGPREAEQTESNIAYMTLDMQSREAWMQFMFQRDKLRKINPAAWFCDIVHTSGNMGQALKLMKNVEATLGAEYPHLVGAKIVVRINHINERRFRARESIEQATRDMQTKNVQWKGIDRKPTPGGIILS